MMDHACQGIGRMRAGFVHLVVCGALFSCRPTELEQMHSQDDAGQSQVEDVWSRPRPYSVGEISVGEPLPLEFVRSRRPMHWLNHPVAGPILTSMYGFPVLLSYSDEVIAYVVMGPGVASLRVRAQPGIDALPMDDVELARLNARFPVSRYRPTERFEPLVVQEERRYGLPVRYVRTNGSRDSFQPVAIGVSEHAVWMLGGMWSYFGGTDGQIFPIVLWFDNRHGWYRCDASVPDHEVLAAEAVRSQGLRRFVVRLIEPELEPPRLTTGVDIATCSFGPAGSRCMLFGTPADDPEVPFASLADRSRCQCDDFTHTPLEWQCQRLDAEEEEPSAAE